MVTPRAPSFQVDAPEPRVAAPGKPGSAGKKPFSTFRVFDFHETKEH